MGLLGRVRDRVQANMDPEAFARRLGANLNGRVRFYGISRATLGSEPWMITFGDNVIVAAGCQFVTHDGGTMILRKEQPDLEWSAPIRIGDDVYFGVNTLVLPGVTIGSRVVVGAHAVVTRDVPDNSVVAGNPARLICSVDEYLAKMRAKSLGIGHLVGEAKDRELRRIYGYPDAGNS
ncbi:hypothetical protein GCM10011584_29080 [Nocardioides phosphati]|uniref:Acyltransferase n=1 Tax=Nocardioides phosphati TaxID=1867775 RepID=A0ABQ2NCC0_9ACTN|nr:DapH/DapD/GlmU-related protein [Nocardioides phosphati]GGO92509.1 hypothetical protein GCM10011584_29080 [Nocardioides phosphati]